INFVQKFPGQKFVINHFAKPNVKENELSEWKVLIHELATSPNVFCKLSGLFTEAHWKKWSAGEFYPYLDVVFESFGANRLMYGSDWPVILLSGMYVQWKSLLEKYMEHFAKEEIHKVFGENARHFYGLEN
ncbi:MAG: amidohydrolase, partial [Chitinophagaceae bacterium]|nr:amidohydrolase [Chitinophagaceae bacterium]